MRWTFSPAKEQLMSLSLKSSENIQSITSFTNDPIAARAACIEMLRLLGVGLAYSDADRAKADDDLSRMRDVLSQSDCETQYQPL